MFHYFERYLLNLRHMDGLFDRIWDGFLDRNGNFFDDWNDYGFGDRNLDGYGVGYRNYDRLVDFEFDVLG